jgi:hypothetical protein
MNEYHSKSEVVSLRHNTSRDRSIAKKNKVEATKTIDKYLRVLSFVNFSDFAKINSCKYLYP